MRRRPLRTLVPLVVTAAATLAISSSIARTAWSKPKDFAEASVHVENARRDGNYSFCSKPKLPLGEAERALCPMAADVEGCEGFVAACRGASKPAEKKDAESSSWGQWLSALGAFARGLVWFLVALVIAAVAAPLVLAFFKARRDKALADAPRAPNVAVAAARETPPEPEQISDAEAALRDADDHARRGELGRALSLYLAASLAALDRRGSIRLARHRTNGEYVRACEDPPARQSLRAIVREVDQVEFGQVAPTNETVARVAVRASDLVRSNAARGAAPSSMATMALSLLAMALVLPLAACSAGGGAGSGVPDAKHGPEIDDPAGNELPMELLKRTDHDVDYLDTSLVALPIPGPKAAAPVVIVDAKRVLLEEETITHLMLWVDSGGVLVLLGAPSHWPKELHVEEEPATSNILDVVNKDVDVRGARLAAPRGIVWDESTQVGWVGGSVYAAYKRHQKGVIFGIASNELFTNVGVARLGNAAAFAALIDVAMTRHHAAEVARHVPLEAQTNMIRVARGQDGIAPPSNPFAAIIQAGLGKGAWHALAAALILFLAFGIRHARARPPAPATRRAFAEHVEATGAFYGRARALGHALASYGRFVEMRLRERVPRGSDPVQFLATRANVPHAEAARLWKRATEARAEDPPHGDELVTIRDLGAMVAKALETTRATI